MAKSKFLILDDVLFAYSLMILLDILSIIKLELPLLLISSFSIASFLTYVEPIDLMLRKAAVRTLERMGGSPKFLFEKSFEHSCLVSMRLRLRTTVYILIILGLVFWAVSIEWIRLISFLASVAITVKSFSKDFNELLYRMAAVAGFIAAIRTLPPPINLEWHERKLENIRHSLEEGDWLEAMRNLWVIGLSGEVRIPEKIIKKALSFSDT